VKVVTILEVAAAVLLILVGFWVAWESLKEPMELRSGRERFLFALHEASRAGFWLALGGWFLGLAFLEEPQTWRWFIIVPIGMAVLRLAARAFLGMSQ
jgi:hypothetical protein